MCLLHTSALEETRGVEQSEDPSQLQLLFAPLECKRIDECDLQQPARDKRSCPMSVYSNDENCADFAQRVLQGKAKDELVFLRERLALETRRLREASGQYKRLRSEVRVLNRRVRSKGRRLALEVAEAEEARRQTVQRLGQSHWQQLQDDETSGSNNKALLLPPPALWSEAELQLWEG